MNPRTGRPPDIPGLIHLLVRTRLARHRASLAVTLPGLVVVVSFFAAGLHAARHRDRSAGVQPMAPGRRKGAQTPRIVWNGSGWGVAWVQPSSQGTAVMLARLARDGRRVAEPTAISADEVHAAANPRLAWNGLSYALAWTDVVLDAAGRQQGRVRVARAGADGQRAGVIATLPGDQRDARAPDIASGPRGWGVAWTASPRAGSPWQQWLAEIDTGGHAVGRPRVVRD